ncbi:hypothetical protein [Thermomonospora umbrina]|uniref:hypothetical protein n=1 Tax=Thermomonospora umbrina TaxID=111806 RepID=UPI0011C0EF84|nr:hypothetical protein [Thermomonospora umbrina]
MNDPVDLLEQDQVWCDREGAEHRISDMEPRYCRNVVRFLLRQAEAIVISAGLDMANVRMPDVDTEAYWSVERGMQTEMAEMTNDPVAWLLSTPLLTALIARGGRP